eukprot:4346670-Pleurochrysis_carterae.AAC.2
MAWQLSTWTKSQLHSRSISSKKMVKLMNENTNRIQETGRGPGTGNVAQEKLVCVQPSAWCFVHAVTL